MLDALVLLLPLGDRARLLSLLPGFDSVSSRLGTLRIVADRGGRGCLTPMDPPPPFALLMEPIDAGESVLRPGSSNLGGSDGALEASKTGCKSAGGFLHDDEVLRPLPCPRQMQ